MPKQPPEPQSEVVGLKRRLTLAAKQLGLAPEQEEQLRAVLDGRKVTGPVIGRETSKRIREVCARPGDSAVVVLTKNRTYRVFTPEGYGKIKASGKARGAQITAAASGGNGLASAGAPA